MNLRITNLRIAIGINGDETREIKYMIGIFIKPKQYIIINVKQM